MDQIVVTREAHTGHAEAVFGTVTLNGIPMGDSMEPTKTLISTGTYKAYIHNSNKFKRKVIMLKDVPYKTAIEIHGGNRPSNSTGCILVGKRVKKELWSTWPLVDRIISLISSPDGVQVIVR